MEKLISIPRVDYGNSLMFWTFDPQRGSMEKLASAFRVGKYHPEILQYLQTQPLDSARYVYNIMNPVHAFEYYGCNINGDSFPESAISPELKEFAGRLYGHKTFLHAGNYQHHINKNPELSFGSPVVVIYNPYMHRIELLNRMDRQKADQVGARHIIRSIDLDEIMEISMGMRTPFDICSVCHNLATKEEEYCEHLIYPWGRNKILPDGRLVCMHNPYPNFFDVSYISRGADQIAKGLVKVASAYGQPTAAYLAYHMNREKVAGLPVKQADIEKPTGLQAAMWSMLPRLTSSEPPLPVSRLVQGPGDLSRLLSTLTYSGIIASPQEYSAGEQLDPEDVEIHPSLVDPDIFRSINRFVPDRTFFPPFIHRRIIIVLNRASRPQPLDNSMLTEPYVKYRRAVMHNLAGLDTAFEQNPELPDYFFGTDWGLSKTASVKGVVGVMLTVIPLIYAYSAHLRNRRDIEGEKLGILGDFLANNPSYVSTTVAGNLSRLIH